MAILVFEHSSINNVARLGAALRNHGQRLRTIRVHAGDPIPPDLDDVDGIICMGGSPNAWADGDDLSWMDAEMALLRQAHAVEMPIVGICLGSQILARALGGKGGVMDGGIELGWHDITLTPVGREDPLHAGIAWQCPMFHWHRACVTELPPDARLLASSEKCKVQAWALGTRTYGFQYHPEIRPATIEDWIDDEPHALEEAGITHEKLDEQTAATYPTFERLTERMFEAMALLLMPVDRRYAGLAKALHH